MPDKTEKKHLFDNPRNVSRLLGIFYTICVLLVIADFVVHRHTEMTWEEFPAFYAVYGFVACVVLVIAAKLMRKLVMRKEDYYDE